MFILFEEEEPRLWVTDNEHGLRLISERAPGFLWPTPPRTMRMVPVAGLLVL